MLYTAVGVDSTKDKVLFALSLDHRCKCERAWWGAARSELD